MTPPIRSGARALAVTLLAALFAGGCATVPSGTPDPAETPGPDVATDAGELDPIGRAATGAVVALPPGNALGSRRVRVIEEYRAASGRLCRHVARANEANVAVVCRRTDGHWSVTRALAVDDAATR